MDRAWWKEKMMEAISIKKQSQIPSINGFLPSSLLNIDIWWGQKDG